MTQVRGRSIRGVLRYVKRSGHPGGIPALLRHLPDAIRPAFAEPIRSFTWYPYPVYSGLLETVDREMGAGDLSLMEAVGAFSLRADAGTTLKILGVFSSVDALVHRGFSSWGPYLWRHHCDRGSVTLIDSAQGTATMGLEEFPDIAAAHCRLNVGYLAEMGRAVGAADIRMIKTECVHRGDARCAYRGEW